jgi:flagellar protein FliL
MADTAAPQETDAKPRRKTRAMAIGAVAATLLGAAGFAATYTGILGGGGPHARADGHAAAGEPLADLAFVPIQPMILSLGRNGGSEHLRFGAEIEVPSAYAPEVTLLLPRILDVLNGYLRAVELAELEDPSALMRLRAQMLRRVQIVAGEGRVRDLLITEFVLN